MTSGALTHEQRTAAESCAQDVLVSAPAGSGKTAVIEQRVSWLVAHGGTAPEDIAIVTYTNEAARVIQERLDWPVGFAGTLHTFCMRAIRGAFDGADDWRVIDDDEMRERLLAAAAHTAHHRATASRLAKVHAEWEGGEINTPDKIAVSRYRQMAIRDGAIDYDFILAMADGLFRDGRGGRRWEHLIVDEWQDAAAIDWQIYQHARPANRFFVGDPNQAIFGFRERSHDAALARAGATLGWTRLELTENFRSTPEICAAASKLAGGLPLRPARLADGGQSAIHARQFDNEAQEALAIAVSLADPAEAARTAVLARTNAVADYIREILGQHGINTRHLVDLQRPDDWRMAMAALGWLARPKSTRALRRYMSAKFPGQDIDAVATRMDITGDADKLGLELMALDCSVESTLLITDRLEEMPTTASLLDLESSLALERNRAEEGDLEGAFVGTIHGAKGREFYRVILAGFSDEIIPGGQRKSVNMAEERRIAYVGVTRARDQLIFTWARSRRVNYGVRHPEPHTASRFIKDALL